MPVKYANYVRTVLSADLSAAALSCVVASVSGFPALGSGDYFYLTLTRLSDAYREIVKVTNVSGKTLTLSLARWPRKPNGP